MWETIPFAWWSFISMILLFHAFNQNFRLFFIDDVVSGKFPFPYFFSIFICFSLLPRSHPLYDPPLPETYHLQSSPRVGWRPQFPWLETMARWFPEPSMEDVDALAMACRCFCSCFPRDHSCCPLDQSMMQNDIQKLYLFIIF